MRVVCAFTTLVRLAFWIFVVGMVLGLIAAQVPAIVGS